MGLTRRRFLAFAGISIGAPALGTGAPQQPGEVLLLSARGDRAGAYGVSGLGEAGDIRFDQPLPGRGHGISVHPLGHQAVCVARRPGDFLLVLDLPSGQPLALLETPEGRHCYGHGCFSADGSLFYTTENAIDSGTGRIGVWDVANGYRRLGEFPSHGIGPHELLLAPGGDQLIVANGGVLTRPETGRAKLNLDTMEPSLVYLDRRDGRLIAEHRLPPELHRLSIRHLALARDGIVCAALQYEGPADEHPPLVALQRPGQGLDLVSATPETLTATRNYCGSAAADPSGAWLAVSAPRGNLVTFWDVQGGFRGTAAIADGCGVAPGDDPGTFYLSSGKGTLYRHDCWTGRTAVLTGSDSTGIQWDNHLTLCG